MTPAVQQRLAVNALIEHLEFAMCAGTIPRSLKLQKLLAKVREEFRPRLVVVGDAPAEEAQYDRTLDVVQQEIGARDV